MLNIKTSLEIFWFNLFYLLIPGMPFTTDFKKDNYNLE